MSLLYFRFHPIPENHEFVECSICLSPWRDPLEQKPCGHIVCRGCIPPPIPAVATAGGCGGGATSNRGPPVQETSGAAGLPPCPVCRSAVAMRDPPNRVLLNVLMSLKGACSLCSWQGVYDGFAGHCSGMHRGARLAEAREVSHADLFVSQQQAAAAGPSTLPAGSSSFAAASASNKQPPTAALAPDEACLPCDPNDPLASIPVWTDYNLREVEFERICRGFRRLAAASEPQCRELATLAAVASPHRAAGSLASSGPAAASTPPRILSEARVLALALHVNTAVTTKDVAALFDMYHAAPLERYSSVAAAAAAVATTAIGVELHQVLAWLALHCRQHQPLRDYGPALASKYDMLLNLFTVTIDTEVRGVVQSPAQVKLLAEMAGTSNGNPIELAEAQRVFTCAKAATAVSSQGCSLPLQAVVRDAAMLHEVLLALETSDDGWDLAEGATSPSPVPQQATRHGCGGGSGCVPPRTSPILAAGSAALGDPPPPPRATAPPASPPASVGNRPHSGSIPGSSGSSQPASLVPNQHWQQQQQQQPPPPKQQMMPAAAAYYSQHAPTVNGGQYAAYPPQQQQQFFAPPQQQQQQQQGYPPFPQQPQPQLMAYGAPPPGVPYPSPGSGGSVPHRHPGAANFPGYYQQPPATYISQQQRQSAHQQDLARRSKNSCAQQ